MWTKIQEEIDKLKKEGIDPYCISFNARGYKRALIEGRLITLNKEGRLVVFGLMGALNPYQCREMTVLASPDNEFLYSEALAKIRWSDELTKDDFVER